MPMQFIPVWTELDYHPALTLDIDFHIIVDKAVSYILGQPDGTFARFRLYSGFSNHRSTLNFKFSPPSNGDL